LSAAIEVRGLSDRTFERETFVGRNGVARRTRDGEFVWSAVVRAEGAGGIRVHVTDFKLPGHVELYLYSRDGQAHGPYVAKGPNGTGEFWTATIFGSEAILQFRGASNADVRGISFRITAAGLMTPRFAGALVRPTAKPGGPPPSFCGNAQCIVDATCQSGFTDVKNAVAKIEWIQGAYIYTCTGGLINDNDPLQDNYFLTANHCVSKDSNAKNVNFYWRFATSTCNGTCPSNNGWPYQTSGSRVAISGRKGDFTLLQLNSAPPSGSVFLGWTNTAVANTNGTTLDRVSNPNFGPQVYSQHQVDTSAGTCRSWPRGERIYSRDIVGGIDGGSSGSPVVNASSQIVGQLSGTCGLSPSNVCSSGPGEDNATVDGAFAFYYSSVQPFLNP
jgi:V8-like Glu-specific endopeptidase